MSSLKQNLRNPSVLGSNEDTRKTMQVAAGDTDRFPER